MIYTVTFNPSLDYIVSVDDFQLGMTNRTSSEMILPGGKGINVSTVLGNLGIESTALGFAAGFVGDEIVRRVDREHIRSEFIYSESGCSRINVKLQNIEGTEINGNGPDISADMIEQLMSNLERLVSGDTLVLAGSIPQTMPDDMYSIILEHLAGRGILTVVDATQELLLHVLPYHPFLIKPNNHELAEIFGVKLQTREECIPYAEKLQEMGARNVLVSLAGEGALLVAEDGEIFSSPAPKGQLINGVGAGDSMVAGFLAGWMERASYERAFYMGVAAGSASAFSEYLATREQVDEVYNSLMEERDLR